ncbi:MAG: hypothetical protein NVS9B10_16910 [Nevskia sp.]
MAYRKVSIPNLDSHEHAVLLDSGEYVALWAERRTVEGNRIAYKIRARAVSAEGVGLTDGHGEPISATLSHTAPASKPVSAEMAACVAAILGETQTGWHPDAHGEFLESVSIRSAIVAAAHAGVVSDLDQHFN